LQFGRNEILRRAFVPLKQYVSRTRFSKPGADCRNTIMNDDAPLTPEIESFDPMPESKSRIADVTEAVKDTANRIGEAIETGKKPGMPLSILSNIAREAPLGSLLVAFLLGVAVARRR
jgi:hypothetical protein